MAENVELVRRALGAISRGDFDEATADFADDFELDFSNSRAPISGVYRGRVDTRDFLRSFLEPWADIDFDEEMTVLSDGRVLAVNSFRARGHGSGVEVAASGATIWTIRDGSIVAVKMYQSKEEALEAAG